MSSIVYLHGFNSSPQSRKATEFARAIAALPEATRPAFHIPVLSHRPALAIAAMLGQVEREIATEGTDAVTLIGSSLGGFYATHVAEQLGVRAVLINPAVRPYAALQSYAGMQRNPYTGEEYVLSPAHFDELRVLAVPRITLPGRYFLLQRSGDEVLDWNEAVTYYAGARQYVLGGGDHGWVEFGDEVKPVLRFAKVV